MVYYTAAYVHLSLVLKVLCLKNNQTSKVYGTVLIRHVSMLDESLNKTAEKALIKNSNTCFHKRANQRLR